MARRLIAGALWNDRRKWPSILVRGNAEKVESQRLGQSSPLREVCARSRILAQSNGAVLRGISLPGPLEAREKMRREPSVGHL